MTKRILTLALTVVLVIAVIPASLAAEGYTEVVAPKYDWFGDFHEDVAGVELNGLWGFIDKTGKEIIAPVYESFSNFSEGLAAVCLDERWGFIDKTGTVVVELTYSYADSFHDGLAAVYQDGMCGFIDKTGTLVIPHTYESDKQGFHNGLAAVSRGGLWGFIDKTGIEVIAPQYSDVKDFNNGFAAVAKQEPSEGGEYKEILWGFIDVTGKEIVAPRYFEVGNYNEGLAAVAKDYEQWGFINMYGTEVIAPVYGSVTDFSRNAALCVRKDGDGNVTGLFRVSTGGALTELPLSDTVKREFYDMAYFADANEGLYRFDAGMEGQSDFVLDQNGKLIAYYDFIGSFHSGYSSVAQFDYDWESDEYTMLMGGYIDTVGNLTVLPYSQASALVREGMLAVDMNGKWGYIAITASVPEKPTAYAADAVNRAVSLGLVPDNLRYQYTRATTRAEFCALAVKLYETVTGTEITQYKSFDDTYDINVEKIAGLGVVSGTGDGTRFNPKGTLNREQAATLLSNLAKALGKPFADGTADFADTASVSGWASAAVGQVQAGGLMNGVGGNRFDPKGDYSREQSIVTMLKLYDRVK